MKKTTNKILSALIAASMILGMVTTATVAAEPDTGSTDATVQETTVEAPAEEQEEPAAQESYDDEEPVEEQLEESAEQAESVEAEEPEQEEEYEEPAGEQEAAPTDVEDEEEAAVIETTEEQQETAVNYPALNVKDKAKVKDSNNKETTVTVTVDAPEGAFPEGTRMVLTPVRENDTLENSDKTVLEAVQETTDKEIVNVIAVDIAFEDAEGRKVEPLVPISVSLKSEKLAAENAAAEDLAIVHIDDQGEPEELKEAEINQSTKTAEFESDAFSVYAIVETGSTEEEARITVNFFGKDQENPIATVYVKNGDTAEHIETIVYDPGTGTSEANKLNTNELFDGWSVSEVNETDGKNYTTETEGKSIEEIRSDLEGMTIHEGDVLNIYAMIFKIYTITYLGENEVSVGADKEFLPVSESSVDHTINRSYTPLSSTENFEGWNVRSGGENISAAKLDGNDVEAPYEQNTVLTLTGDVTLSAYAPSGSWLVFDAVKKGATYNAPQFYTSGEVTTDENVLTPECVGFRFAGWYEDPAYTTEFHFGSALQGDKTIYAKWEEETEASYTVIVWVERMSDTYAGNVQSGSRNYDFAESFSFTGNVGETIDKVVRSTTSYETNADGTVYYDAVIDGTLIDGVRTKADYTGYHCDRFDENVTIKSDGTAVVNVYYDRNTVTYTFYRPQYTRTTSTTASPQYGLVNGNYYELTYHSSRPSYWTYYAETTSNNGTQYAYINGTYYQLERHGNFITGYYWTLLYEGQSYYWDGTRYTETQYNGNRYTVAWTNVYRTLTGLYGETVSWPEDQSLWWYEEYTGNQGTGTRMTYKSDFIPLGSNMNVPYYGNVESGSGSIIFYTQDLNSTNYTAQYTVAANGGRFNINDKFTGFRASQYRTDDGSWTNVGSYNPATGIYGDEVSYSSKLEIRYDRIKGTITFMDGAYFNGDGGAIDETPKADAFSTSPEYYYQDDVSSYNKDGADYADTIPTCPHEGYTFAGWYADDACTQEYNFTNMPATGITVYAKWIQDQYRVFFHPNVPESDTTLNWGSDDVELNFRKSYGDKISLLTGTRNDYDMIGWYTDEACTIAFAPATVLNGTTVKTAYDQNTDLTDPMNKWGNIDGTGTNSDKANGRFWITKKFDLYAKWSAKLPGADGIGVKYDPNGGSNAPTDSNLYKDNVEAVAQGASTPPDSSQQFLYWVKQKWEWDDETHTTGRYVDTGTHVYPGNLFIVLKEDAQTVELEDSTEENPHYTYTVQLRAEYGPVEAETPTHITWYGNGGTNTYEIEDVDGKITNVGDTVTYINLQINQKIPAAGADTFTRDGYKFIGWARETEPAGAFNEESNTVDASKYSEKQNLTLWLQLNEDGETFTEVGTDHTNVTEVAADEKTPYHALYAVWEKREFFQVYHSGVAGGNIEKVYIDTLTDGKYDITQNLTAGTIYGGYYSAYHNENAAYEGDQNSWKAEEAYTTAIKETDLANNVGGGGYGDAMTPVADMIYYVKEIPDSYVKPSQFETYYYFTGVEQSIYLVTALDDANYQEAGFIISGKTDAAGEVYSTLTITYGNHAAPDSATNNYQESLTVGDFFPALESGYICALQKDDILTAGTSTNFRPYLVTPDSMKVIGATMRRIKVGSRQNDEGQTVITKDDVKVTDYNSASSVAEKVAAGTGGAKAVRLMVFNRLALEIPDEEESAEDAGAGTAPEEPEEEEPAEPEPVLYTITKIDAGGTSAQTVEPGNYKGKIPYTEKAGYYFAGWYTDQECTSAADFTDVTADMTVYAKYISASSVSTVLSGVKTNKKSSTLSAYVAVADPDIAEAGMVIVSGGNQASYSTADYKTVNKSSLLSRKKTKEYQFSGSAQLPALKTGATVKATAYWLTKDGTLVTFETESYYYLLGILI